MASLQKERAAWRGLILQLGGCLLLAAVAPFLLRLLTIDADAVVPLEQTFYACLAAIVLGVWLLRNLTTYPGVEASGYIVPAFTISFSVLLLVLVLGRIEYNRLTLSLGFILSLGWFFAIYLRGQRHQQLKIGYIPITPDDVPAPVRGVSWTMLTSPAVDASGFDAIATDLRVDLPEEWDRRLADFSLAGIPVMHLKHLRESLTGRVELEHLSENSFGSLIPLSAYKSAKQAIDWVTALAAGFVLFVPLLLVGLAVKLSSPGPILFRQQRIGYRGDPFIVYKFRTMTVAPEGEAGREAAITRSNDARVTRLGRFLRTTRIDELPQIVNILRGEMSWIGPRPEAEVLSRWYEQELPFYRYRHIVRPGIAGWAQVCQGHVAEVAEVRDKLHYDFYYIKHFSPWIDILIIARTIRTVVTGFGSR